MDINVVNVLVTVIVHTINIAQEVVVTPVQDLAHQTVHAQWVSVVVVADVINDKMTVIL